MVSACSSPRSPDVALRLAPRVLGCYRDGVAAVSRPLLRSPPKSRLPERSVQLADLDDAGLIVALVAGREEALGELYDRYGDLLMAIGLRMLGNHAEAEDLVHDVIVEAWRRAADFDPARGGVRAWLVTRARSRALDRVKSPGRQRVQALDPEAHERLPAASADPGGADHDRLRRAVALLTPEQRAVVEAAYFDGLSSSEMATVLGIPIGTVKSRMASGLAKLRAALGAE